MHVTLHKSQILVWHVGLAISLQQHAMQLGRAIPKVYVVVAVFFPQATMRAPSAQCLMARQHLHNWLGHAAAAELRRALSSRGRVAADANLQGLESHDERRMYFNLCL